MSQKKYYELCEEKLSKYLDCWRDQTSYRLIQQRPSSIYESINSGCEHLQMLRDLNIEDFSYEDICNLPWLLTRELQAQINRDHFLFWTWVQSIAHHINTDFSLRNLNSIFADNDWINAFNSLVNMMILTLDVVPIAPPNYILLGLLSKKYLLAGPLSYAVLEGLLRRKNSNYVTSTGEVVTHFTIRLNGQSKVYDPSIKGSSKVNNISHQLALFEQNTIPYHRANVGCIGLSDLKTEVERINTSLSLDSLITESRHELMHGNTYWQNRVPIIINLICLLLLDEISPSEYSTIASRFTNTLDHSHGPSLNSYYQRS